MTKRIVSLLVCILLIFCLPLSVLATEEGAEITLYRTLTLSTKEQFLTFAENCRLDSYSEGLNVSLGADIDLAGTDFSGIPIFCGSFDGRGHTISGLRIQASGSSVGLFRYLAPSATVQNLTVHGSVQPQGSRDAVGSIAGENAGIIQDCRFFGTVSGSDHVGGIAGRNTVSGVIQNCRTDGQVHGDHFVGGIAGNNMGVIRTCINMASVNTTPQQNSVELSDITLDSLTSSESAGTVTDVGGIAGTSGGLIRDCDNFANIGYRQMGYNIGGIAGSQMGYIADCQNFGEVSGRKEVGGIVGQMEPVTSIVYTTDTLQILQGQLDVMGGLAGRASANVQSSGSAITGQVASIQQYTQSAKDAVEQLIPSAGNPLPDPDSIQAAQNALSSSISGMQSSIQSIASTAQTAVATLSSDIQAISNQVNAMGATLKNASENLGGALKDVSDSDTPEDLSGKVERCSNFGGILADLNAGGIAGAINLENDLDPEEDIDITGEMSLNFDSELRAVILNCENSAAVTVTKQNGGGIAGRAALGLIRQCCNTGRAESPAADYIGGIAGQSSGFIRNCYAKCALSGSSYVGGIAGMANTLSDNRSIVQLSAQEKLGAVVGFTEHLEEITGNFYMTLEQDPGAIDGISYDGLAQPLPTEEFLALEDLPAAMRSFCVSFVFADGSKKVVTVTPGQSLQESDIPALPEKAGYTASWDNPLGLRVPFDREIPARYVSYASVLAADSLRKDGRPVVLAEGVFSPDARIFVEAVDSAPALGRRQTLCESIQITLPESALTTVRYLPPAGTQPDTLLMQDASGSWQSVEFTAEGSYLVFQAQGSSLLLAAAETQPIPWLWIIAAGVILSGLGLCIGLIARKKKA